MLYEHVIPTLITFIREFGICQHVGRKTWQETLKKKTGKGLFI
jgi:hypothetical protein